MRSLRVLLSLDRVVCSVNERHRTPFDPGRLHDMSNYKLIKSYKQKDRNKYQFISEFIHERTGLTLIISSGPSIWGMPPYLLCFNSSWNDKLTLEHVEGVEGYFRTLNMSFRIAEVHPALDIHSGNENTHSILIKSLRTGKKRLPHKIIERDHYFGKPSCPSVVFVYDKASQLRRMKGIDLDHFCGRVETRLQPARLNNFLRTVQELADHDWSWLYGKYFSFHRPNKYLIEVIHKEFEETFAKELLTSPLWYLRDVITQEFEMPSHNFYRDYLEEVPELAEPVKKSLSKYRWRNKK